MAWPVLPLKGIALASPAMSQDAESWAQERELEPQCGLRVTAECVGYL